MKKHWILTTFLAVALCVICVVLFPTEAKAASRYDLTFTLNSDGESYCVSDCDYNASGELEIPSAYNGKPVTGIGYRAFYECYDLTSIIIPDSVTSIGDYAFYNCRNLTSITIPDGVTSIGKFAFNNCDGLTSITIPESVTFIGDSAFHNCSNLTDLVIGNGVVSLGDSTFYYCTNLTNVTLGTNVSSIGNSTFFGCYNLREIAIPGSVTSIGNSAFSGCKNLTSITIPDSVTSIGKNAFWGCESLTSIRIGSGVTSIGDQVFYTCGSLTEIIVSESNTCYSSDAYGVLFNKDKSELICAPGALTGEYAIPSSVTIIHAYAFDRCKNLTDITIPNSVTSIGDSAFYNCEGLTNATLGNGITSIGYKVFYGCEGLTSITIPNSVTTIERQAFTLCSDLTRVNLGKGVTSIGNEAFSWCSSLTDVYYGGTENQWTQVRIGSSNSYLTSANIHFNYAPDPEYLSYNINEGGAYITDCDESVTGDIILPDTLGGYPVTGIGNSAFENCSNLTSITIPYGVTSIGDYAFYYCSSLESITIPDSVTSIGEGAFSYCYKSTSITIGDGVTSISDYAFSGCSRLESITIPDGITSIGKHAFSSCYNLTSVTLPDGVTNIGKYAFYDCFSLESITIPDSVTSIGKRAFNYSSLTDVYYDGTAEQWGQIEIDEDNNRLTSANIHFNNVCAHSYDNACDTTCNTCGETRITSHNYETTTTKATLSKNGSIVKKCSVCGDVASSTVIAKPTTFTLAATSYVYDGNVKTPAVTVKDANGKTLVKDTDYTVTYASGRKALGSYNVTITMKGNYSGTKTLNFTINLATPTVKAANATNGVKVSWGAISGAKTYTVYRSVYSSGAWSGWKAIKTGVTGTSYTDTTVKSNANVKYTVRAVNGSYASAYKASNAIKFLATPTVKVANAAKGVTVTWNKISGAKTYVVYRSVYSGGAWSGWKAIKTDVTGTSYTDTTVKSNANVKYTVKALNGNYASAYKSSSAIKFLATPTVKAANAAKGVTVTWNKISGAKTYTVYRSVYSGGKWSGWTAIKTGVTGTSYTDTTVKSGATVRYTVKAINGNYNSNVKASNTTKFLAQPKVTVAKVSNGIKASWGKITGASGYIVYRRTYSNGKWGAWEKVKTTTGLSFTDTTAKKGVTYQYTVRAYSGDYKSTYTNSSSIKR